MKSDTMDVHDESLIARVAQGDSAAFEIVYDRYAPRVLGLLMQINGERDAAEELLQQVFWQVWQNAGTFPAQHRSFMGWLFMIVRNLVSVSNAGRGDSPRRTMKPMHQDSMLDAGVESTQRSELGNLPPRQRQVIELAFFQGMTRQQIANSMGETLDAISSLAKQGMRNLQDVLEQDAKLNRK
jgi:RNA polymerase sigma-70 factor (ECF subfamily)